MARIALMLALLARAMTGQQLFSNGGITYGPDHEIRAVFSGFHPMAAAVVSAPYSADTVFEHPKALADGTVTQQTTLLEHMSRDSQGRIRVERPLLPQGEQSPTLVQIFDVVAGCGYILDEQNKVAHRVTIKAPAGVEIDADGGEVYGVPAPTLSSRERLGTRTIEGVVTEGTRLTTTWAPGSQGNDRPFSRVTETWYSQELKTMLISKTISASEGETTLKRINVTRIEAAPALFPSAARLCHRQRQGFRHAEPEAAVGL
jgi:hypothetical protein